MPTSLDLTVQRGNTFARTFRMKDGEDNLIDLTGATLVFRATLRGAELFRMDTPVEFAMPDPVSGDVTLTLSPADTRLIPEGRLVRYEIEHRLDDIESTLIEGFLIGTGGTNDDEDA